MFSIEFEANVKSRFSYTRLVRKLESFYLPQQGWPFCLNVQCFIYSPLHVHLRVTHALSYGDKRHLYDCACVRRGLAWRRVRIRGYSMCTRVHAQTLQHARQGRTLLDYSPIECLKPAMLVSSVHWQAVVACYATAPRVLLFIV